MNGTTRKPVAGTLEQRIAQRTAGRRRARFNATRKDIEATMRASFHKEVQEVARATIAEARGDNTKSQMNRDVIGK